MKLLIRYSAYLCLCAGALFAQGSSATFYGEVTDQSGARVSGVHIVVTLDSTGFSRQTTTDSTGAFRVPDLDPGIYSIAADRKGFRTLVTSRLTLQVNQKAKVDLRLDVGSARETVTVVGTISLLQTDDNSEGYNFAAPVISQLPLNGRNVLSLITVGPGAVPRQLGGYVHDGDNDVQESSRGSVALNAPINGARSFMNAYLVDGANNTDRNTFASVVIPPLDSVQEFHVQTSLAGPASSEAGGGVIDIATKSGSRDFHGGAFEFLRNEATDARNYFDDPTLPRPIFRQNQFGASLGGPLLVASTFFFASYEGVRSKSASSSLQIVPDAGLRSGNFQGAGTIHDPLALSTDGVRAPFSGNVIPATRIDSIASKYLARYEPLPNRAPGSSSNYLDSTPSTTGNDSGSFRADHQFRERGLLFGRYTINNEDGNFAGSFPLRPTSELLRAQQAVLGHTFARPGWINDARLYFTRLQLTDAPATTGAGNEAAALGIADATRDPVAFGLPYFFLTDFSTVTDSPNLPQTQRDNTWGLSDTLTFVSGRHTWNIGFDGTYSQLNYQRSNLIRGRYTYTGSYTADSLDGSGGDALADFLLGFPLRTERSVGSPLAYLRQSVYAAFVQHDWQVSSRLALNLGVRYEYISPFTEARHKLLNLDYSTLPADPQLRPTGSVYDPNRVNFAPRAGLAWRIPGWLSKGGDSLLRAGYGIYFNGEIADEAYALVLNGIQNQINETSGTGLPSLTTRNGFASTASAGLSSYFGIDRHSPTPYVQQWNTGVQRALPGHILFEASYVGSKGTHLGRFRRFNTALHTETGEDLGPRPGDLQQLRTFPGLGTLFQRQHIANSSYNSLQLKLEKRFSRSLTFLVNYVWSKSIDDADSILVGQYDSAGAQNENNLHLERGLSFANVPRRLSAEFVYAIPSTRFLRPVLRGWQLSGLITLQDGTPLNPFYIASDIANTGTPNRPNVVPGQSISLPSGQRTVDRWFNTNAFSDPAPFTFGNAGRNIIPGPGNEVTDLGVSRRIRIGERAAVQIRAEGFNLLNHPNFGIPGPYPDLGPFFAKIFSTGSPRRIQFGARIDF